jgi:O-antigen/teichoic acid export membrane protein
MNGWYTTGCNPPEMIAVEQPKIVVSKAAAGEHREYLKELLWNQIWQSANFVSKAGFLLLMTPLMLKRWGADGFGLFGLSSSLLVSMALTDGGVRSLTRLRLSEALRNNDEAEFRRALSEGLLTFVAVLGFVVILVAGLAASGWMRTALKLPPGGEVVLVTTVIMTGISMTTLLALEPLAARGKLSETKAANTWGAIVAIPLCGVVLWLHGSILTIVVLYSLCMIVPNVVLMVKAGIHSQLPSLKASNCRPAAIFQTLLSGLGYYATTIALIVKTHGLTFFVSHLAGPAEAGVFYFMLRLTEMIGSLGATASETSLASLASTENPTERGRKFNHCWLYVALFCLPGAVIFAFQGNWLLHLWFRHQDFVWIIGAGMAIFGLAGAFSRVVVNASMGLKLIKTAALSNLGEAAANIICAVIGYKLAGLPGVLIGGCIGALIMLLPAQKIAAVCGEKFFEAFVRPLTSLNFALALIALTQVAAIFTNSIAMRFASFAFAGIITLSQWRRLHRS